MRNCICLLFAVFTSLFGIAQINLNTATDGDWSKQNIVLANTPEADWMLRIGDIDNLGFGWPKGFIPFSGKSTDPHNFPWNANPEDAKGTDHIYVPSGYKPGSAKCGTDGYTGSTHRPENIPVLIIIPLNAIKNAVINSAALQLFVDDFQAPVLCSKFQVKINGVRFIEMEKLLNSLKQTGPVGKIINIKLPYDFLQMLKTDALTIYIDDPVTGAGDGFAIDFVKLLINPKPFLYKGAIKGIVIDKATREPIKNATAEIKDFGTATTDDGGKFMLENIPAGLNVINGSAPEYASVQAQADVIADETTNGISIELPRSGKITFNNKSMQEGDMMVMNNIQFELSSANLTSAGKPELNKLAAFMKQNMAVEILLSGYTSTDGTDAGNKILSLNRVKSCKQYLVAKGIDEGRIDVMGYGSSKPIAPNDTEQNRAKNRRVEMKITKL